jgi:hypothetical protein
VIWGVDCCNIDCSNWNVTVVERNCSRSNFVRLKLESGVVGVTVVVVGKVAAVVVVVGRVVMVGKVGVGSGP